MRWRLAVCWLTLTAAVAAVVLAVPGAAFTALPPLDVAFGPTTRLLLFAPHPDDEVIGAAGLLQRVTAAGGSVRVVLMTSGDAFPEGVETATHIRHPSARDFRNYGNRRERETIAALRLLGINRTHILFLGFPDGGLCLIASTYLSAKARAFESPYTERLEPPVAEQTIRGATYRGSDIRSEIESIMVGFRPTLIVLPHAEDRHPDHCATSIFVREALTAVHGLTPRIVQYLVHYPEWPDLDADPASPLAPPAGFPLQEGEWRTLELTSSEAALKQTAMAAYPSQQMIIGRFLQTFVRPNELFLEGPVAASPRCWCDTTHVATEAPVRQYHPKPSEHQ